MIYLPLPALRPYDLVTVTLGLRAYSGVIVGVIDADRVRVFYTDTMTDTTDGGTITLERVLPIACVRSAR